MLINKATFEGAKAACCWFCSDGQQRQKQVWVVLTMTSSVLSTISSVLSMTSSVMLPIMLQGKGLARLVEASICDGCMSQLPGVVTNIFVLLLVCSHHIAEMCSH